MGAAEVLDPPDEQKGADTPAVPAVLDHAPAETGAVASQKYAATADELRSRVLDDKIVLVYLMLQKLGEIRRFSGRKKSWNVALKNL